MKKATSYKLQANSGFIALTTTIILSMVILTLVIAVGFSSFFGRFGILDSEINERSSNLAEACAETAALKLSQDAGYEGKETITVGYGSCFICSISSPNSVFIQASTSNAYTNLEVEIDPTDGSIDSWEEIPTISWGSCTT
ncbi:MAG: hypothetical protein AAB458_01395 [Patescibacteria group bacterium]